MQDGLVVAALVFRVVAFWGEYLRHQFLVDVHCSGEIVDLLLQLLLLILHEDLPTLLYALYSGLIDLGTEHQGLGLCRLESLGLVQTRGLALVVEHF